MKQRLRVPSCLGLLVVILAMLPGCGGREPRTYTVKTSVFVNGSPAVGANVTLHPVDGDSRNEFRQRPFGEVTADGTVTFSTFRPNDGAPAGEYIVTIFWPKNGGEQDELRGAHQNPERPNPLKITVANSTNTLPAIEITTAHKNRK